MVKRQDRARLLISLHPTTTPTAKPVRLYSSRQIGHTGLQAGMHAPTYTVHTLMHTPSVMRSRPLPWLCSKKVGVGNRGVIGCIGSLGSCCCLRVRGSGIVHAHCTPRRPHVSHTTHRHWKSVRWCMNVCTSGVCVCAVKEACRHTDTICTTWGTTKLRWGTPGAA